MKIKVGGVNEHFNYPWKLAAKEKSFSNIGIQVEWQDIAGGTGEMCSKLRTGDLDMAVVLTEGIIADIVKGNPSLIVQKFIKSPLVWGIHVGGETSINNSSDWSKLRFAISRKGSGSHIMAHVEAQNRGVELADNQFIEVGDFEKGRKALNTDKADILLWEKFTTSPFVQSGVLKRIGETVTPWPCFVVVAREELLTKHPERVWNMLWKLRKACRQFMNMPNAVSIIADKYAIDPVQAQTWFNQVEWEQDVYISQKMLQNVSNTLEGVGVIESSLSPNKLCWSRTEVY